MANSKNTSGIATNSGLIPWKTTILTTRSHVDYRYPHYALTKRLEQYKTLRRHVHAEPVMIRRAMRIAFRNLSPKESIELRLAGKQVPTLTQHFTSKKHLSWCFFSSHVRDVLAARLGAACVSMGFCFWPLASFHEIQKRLWHARFDVDHLSFRPYQVHTKKMETTSSQWVGHFLPFPISIAGGGGHSGVKAHARSPHIFNKVCAGVTHGAVGEFVLRSLFLALFLIEAEQHVVRANGLPLAHTYVAGSAAIDLGGASSTQVFSNNADAR